MTTIPKGKLPKALQNARDTRDVFTFFFNKAALAPEYCMAPRQGIVRRVVLKNRYFNDRFLNVLETIPNLPERLKGLEELRIVQAAFTQTGIERLRILLPGVRLIEISDEQVATKFITDPRFNVETKQLDISDDGPANNYDIKAFFMERYGEIPRFLQKE